MVLFPGHCCRARKDQRPPVYSRLVTEQTPASLQTRLVMNRAFCQLPDLPVDGIPFVATDTDILIKMLILVLNMNMKSLLCLRRI